jgi:integrase
MASMRTDTIKFLTLQETTRLFHRLASYRREKAIFLLAYRHGLRASEVGMLRIEDIDFKTSRRTSPGQLVLPRYRHTGELAFPGDL